jgi:hypothetical protein
MVRKRKRREGYVVGPVLTLARETTKTTTMRQTPPLKTPPEAEHHQESTNKAQRPARYNKEKHFEKHRGYRTHKRSFAEEG